MTDLAQDFLWRWHERLQKSFSTFNPSVVDERFDDLTVILVTGAYIEAMLWIAVQLAGYVAKGGKKELPLKPLIDVAESRSVLSSGNACMLRNFADLRNDFAHDIDAKLDATRIEALETLLTPERSARVDNALRNIIDGGVGSKARVVLGEVADVAYESLRIALEEIERQR